MRRLRGVVGLLALGGAVVLAGCASSAAELKKPKHPEEFFPPPENDPRYNQPVKYPKELLDEDMLLKKRKDKDGGPGKPPSIQSPSAASRMGASPM
jgi:hypothetical protein